MSNLNNLTIGELKEFVNLISQNGSNKSDHPYEIGKNYLIRTVTMTVVGKLVYVGPHELKMDDASWVADTGRFSNALQKGLYHEESSEIEPFNGSAIVGRGAIVDCVEYKHDLPKDTK